MPSAAARAGVPATRAATRVTACRPVGAQCGGPTQGVLDQDRGEPLDGGVVGGDEPLGERDHPGGVGGGGEGLEVAGAVSELVLQDQILQQRLGPSTPPQVRW